MQATAAAAFLSAVVLLSAAGTQARWSMVPMIPPRSEHAMAFDLARGRTVVFGGLGKGPLLDDTWLWDGTRWERAFPASSPPARRRHAMTFDLVRGVVVLFGGMDLTNGKGDTWEWDGTTWTDRTTPSGPSPRSDAALAYDLFRARVVLLGGFSTTNQVTLGDTWEWDGATWVQVQAPQSPGPLSRHAMAFDYTAGKILLHGGTGASGPRAGSWWFDGRTWTLANPTGPLVHTASMAEDVQRGRVVLVGQQASGGSSVDLYEWDGRSWAQRQTVGAPDSRPWPKVAFDLARGRTVLFGGGVAEVGQALGDTWEWDGAAWLPRGQTVMPAAFEAAAMAFDSHRGRTVLFGGSARTQAADETWEWDGTAWTRAGLVLPRPAGRYAHAMAYDATRRRTFLFGGSASHFPEGDLWTWDGTSWLRQPPTQPAPFARSHHGMVYDPTHDQLVVFGGYNGAVLGDTWTRSGGVWSQRSPVHSPGPRVDMGMAFDEARGNVVLCGGRDPGSTTLSDTWEWDGSDWSQRLGTTGPGPRTAHRLAYDAARQRVVLFGGGPNRTTPQDDVWEWDGSDWRQRVIAHRPAGCFWPALAYDRAREEILLFGGSVGGSLWRYSTDLPARYQTFGMGCAGSTGTPRLDALASSRPWLGDTLTLRLSGLPGSGFAALFTGRSRQSFGGVPLPSVLDGIGMPGCSWYCSAELLQVVAQGPGPADVRLTVPTSAALAGAAFYNQAILTDPAANATGLIVTNAGQGIIGVR